MTTDRHGRAHHTAGAPQSLGGKYAPGAIPGPATTFVDDRGHPMQQHGDGGPASVAKRSLDALATFMAVNEIDSELNEVAADAVAGANLPHPGTPSNTTFWSAFVPTAPQGTPERALQEIGKFLGEQETWDRGSTNYGFIAACVQGGGGKPNPSEEEPEAATERLGVELSNADSRWRDDPAAGGEVVRLSAGLLARQIIADYPNAAAVEIRNDLADDGEMWLQVMSVRDEDGIVIARQDDLWETVQETAVSLDRDFGVLGAMTETALRSRATWGEEQPRSEDDAHFILIDDAVQQTGPTL